MLGTSSSGYLSFHRTGPSTGDIKRWLLCVLKGRKFSGGVCIWYVAAFLGYKSQEKRGKSHRYDSKSSRLKKKPKESSTRRSRVLSQHQAHTHSDEDEDESIPASYHTVSLQVSQDVSIARISSSPFPYSGPC